MNGSAAPLWIAGVSSCPAPFYAKQWQCVTFCHEGFCLVAVWPVTGRRCPVLLSCLQPLELTLLQSGSQTLTLQIPLRTDTGTKNSMHQGYSGTGVLSLTRLEFKHLS